MHRFLNRAEPPLGCRARPDILAATLLSVWLGTRLLSPCQTNDAQTNFFLPKNPVAAAYILGRLSNQELIRAPRSEFVYVALLQRPGLDRKFRAEALEGLAKVRNSDGATELIKAIADLDKKGEAGFAALQELTPILIQLRPADLAQRRSTLNELAGQGAQPLTRQAAIAALIEADGSLDPAWKAFETDPRRLAEMLQALPLLNQAPLLAAGYEPILKLLQSAVPADLRTAGIKALPAIPGHEQQTFNFLSALVVSGRDVGAATEALGRIPRKSWPKEEIAGLLSALLNFLRGVDPAQRTGPDFTRALQLAADLNSLQPAEKAQALDKELRRLGPVVVTIHAVYEQLRYDKQLIVVEPGKPLAIVLQNDDAMPHNLVVTAPGALEEIGVAAEKMPGDPDSQGRVYIPGSPKVLHATKLVAPGQQTQLAFTSPSDPGEYPYVCTFPGHWRRMSGILAVVPDVDAYLAGHAQSQAPITEWKLEDLIPDLPKISPSRNLAEGKRLFTLLACVQCHKLGNAGYAYGPDLTGVLGRYKNDRAAVLQQILEPSRIVEDRYRLTNFDLTGAEPVLGMVLKEDPQTVTVQTGPADSLVQVLKKSDIQKRQPQNSSPMPVGLLNALSKEQILDLLAYIESDGQIPLIHQHTH